MNGEKFSIDPRLLKLGGCDVMLGVDWMKGVSLISFDFNKMEMTFEKDGSKKTLMGNQEVGVCKIISGKKLQRMFRSRFPKVAQLLSIHAVEHIGETTRPKGELYVVVSSQPFIQRNV